MTVETAIAEVILTLTDATDIVGQNVWTGIARQGARVGVVVHGAGGAGMRPHMRGMVTVSEARVQVDSFAPQASGVDAYATANSIDAAIMGPGDGTGLAGWHGTIGSPAFTIYSVFPIGEPVQAVEAGAVQIFKVMRDYLVRYQWSA